MFGPEILQAAQNQDLVVCAASHCFCRGDTCSDRRDDLVSVRELTAGWVHIPVPEMFTDSAASLSCMMRESCGDRPIQTSPRGHDLQSAQASSWAYVRNSGLSQKPLGIIHRLGRRLVCMTRCVTLATFKVKTLLFRRKRFEAAPSHCLRYVVVVCPAARRRPCECSATRYEYQIPSKGTVLTRSTALLARQSSSSFVQCPHGGPTCPACPSNQTLETTVHLDCMRCSEVFCADLSSGEVSQWDLTISSDAAGQTTAVDVPTAMNNSSLTTSPARFSSSSSGTSSFLASTGTSGSSFRATLAATGHTEAPPLATSGSSRDVRRGRLDMAMGVGIGILMIM